MRFEEDEEQGVVRFREIDLSPGGELTLVWTPTRPVVLRSVFAHGLRLLEVRAGAFVLLSTDATIPDQAWFAGQTVTPQHRVAIRVGAGRRGEHRAPFVVLEYRVVA